MNYLMRIYPALFLILSLMVVVAISILQNQCFYKNYGAFYDSMAYLNQLAVVMGRVHTLGFWGTLSSSYNESTVFLPWLMGAFLAYFTEPTRLLGIFIQTPLLALQLITGYRFFKLIGLSNLRSLMFSIPLISYPAIFSFNGGLSDFRMDLSQALIYGSFLASLMIARSRKNIIEWIFVGLIVSLGCLFRATTPVYVLFVLLFTFILDLKTHHIKYTLQRYSAIGGVVFILTGWFYLLNFDHLHYYYFVWNTDANAHLPLSESLNHLSFLKDHLGYPLIFSLLLVIFCSFLIKPKRLSLYQSLNSCVALIGSLVPILYLVLSGAGLNPFVSIVAVPGFILFSFSFRQDGGCFKSEFVNRLFIIILTILFSCSIFFAVQNSFKQISIWMPYKNGVSDLWNSIHDDAKSTQKNNIVISFLYLGSVNDDVITNHLVYEEKFKLDSKFKAYNNKMIVAPLKFKLGAHANWIELPGDTDRKKVEYLISTSLRKSDYVVMADEGSDLPVQHIINSYASYVRHVLQTSHQLEKVKSHIIFSGTETATLYRIKK
jgi:hypothetical protein